MKFQLLAVSLLGAAVAQNKDAFEAARWAQWDASANKSVPDSTPGIPDTTVANCDPNGVTSFEITGTHDITGASTTICWDATEGQNCYNELGKLDNEGFGKDAAGNLVYQDVVNSCRVREEGTGEKVYDFLLTYMQDYEHKDNCVEQEINFIEREVSSYVPGTSDPKTDDRVRFPVPAANANQPWVNVPDNTNDVFYTTGEQNFFSVDHDDLEDEYGCTYTEHDDYYQWVCDIELNIVFSGEIQYTYEFQMVSTLDRVLTDTLDVAVNRNVVNGDCCVNELQVTSSLHFCRDYFCTDDRNGDIDYFEGTSDWNNGIKEVERRQIFYVAHRIDTAEFQNYWLQPVSLHFGPFIPKIHRWHQVGDFDVTHSGSGTTNILVYEVESYVALDNLVIKSVALLDDRDWEATHANFNVDAFDPVESARILEEVGDDYKIKGEANLTVGESSEQEQQKKSKQNNSVLLSFGAAALALFALL